MKWTLYGLVDPDDGRLRYIGCTSNLSQRVSNHFSRAKTSMRPLDTWIRSLAERKAGPTVRILELVNENPRDAEAVAIRDATARGEALFNVSRGGYTPEFYGDRITFQVRPEVYAELQRLASEGRQRMSFFIREAIDDWLRKE